MRAIIFDLEGVFFAGDAVLPGALDVMKKIQEKKIPHRFITNISKQNVSEIYDHMLSIGLTPDRKNIIGLLDYAGIFLRKICQNMKTVFVIGSEELRFSISNAGFEDLTLKNPENVDIVLIGLDEELTYFSMSKASHLVAQGAKFIANKECRLFLSGNHNPDVVEPDVYFDKTYVIELGNQTIEFRRGERTTLDY